MMLFDVNVLVYAHREDAPEHRSYRAWLENVVNADEPFGLSDVALSGFLRVVTHPRVFRTPSSLDAALTFVEGLRSQPNGVPISPGARHWPIFIDLCRRTKAKANIVPDAWFAALAIESGSTWVTADRGFARFPALRLLHPVKVE